MDAPNELSRPWRHERKLRCRCYLIEASAVNLMTVKERRDRLCDATREMLLRQESIESTFKQDVTVAIVCAKRKVVFPYASMREMLS